MINKFLKPIIRHGVLVAAFTAMLGACDTVNTADVTDFFSPRPAPPCPDVNILANAERLTLFQAGPGRDIIDIETEAEIKNFIAQCIYDVDGDTGRGKMYVELSLGISASRGAANYDGQSVLPYFVTITTREKQILNKAQFNTQVVYEGNRYRVEGYEEPVILTVPIEPPATGSDYLIYIGFQLTPEQLRYNEFIRSTGG